MEVVAIRPRSGAYVNKVSSKKLPKNVLPPNFMKVGIGDIVDARLAIELPALQKSGGRIGKGKLLRLERLLAQMEQALEDLPKFLRLDMAFHQALVEESENEVLVMAFEAIFEYHKYSQVFSSLHEGEARKALTFHQKIVSALKAGKISSAVRFLKKHLEEIKQAVC